MKFYGAKTALLGKIYSLKPLWYVSHHYSVFNLGTSVTGVTACCCLPAQKLICWLFNRPSVAGAVLQSPLLRINWFMQWSFSSKPSKHYYKQTWSLNFERMFIPHHISHVMCQVSGVVCQVSHVRCHVSGVTHEVSCVMCQVSCVMCQLSGVTCQLSHVRCHVFLFFFNRTNGGASPLKVLSMGSTPSSFFAF